MEYILKTDSLTKNYKSQKAVDNVNMTIKQGELYGFVGPNGAGKTTIIRLICGLINSTSGTYSLFGTNEKDANIYEARKKVAAVVESPSLYLNMSAYDNLKMQCLLMGIKDERIIDEMLEVVGLSYIKDEKKKVGNYSLGMRQRLGIAVALITKPQLLLLDEPMNGLDPEGIVEIRELLLKLNREQGITILISSHILSELSKVATCYGIINHGRLIKEISAEELEQVCRKCIEVSVANDNVAELIKKTRLHNYEITNDKVKIYDDIYMQELLDIFKNQNIEIKSINNRDENIEEYYLNLVGGVHHE